MIDQQISPGLLYEGVKYVCSTLRMTLIEYKKDHIGNFCAIIKDKMNRRYVIFSVDYLMNTNQGPVKSLNKKGVDFADKNKYPIILYVKKGNYIYKLDSSIIQKKYSNSINTFNEQEMYDRINLININAINMIESRKKRMNKPEQILTQLFKDHNLLIYFTGYGMFEIVGKFPDWKIDGQNKVIEYCGKHWHTTEEIEERKKLFLIAGYKTLIIWEDEEKDIKKLLEKVKGFIKE